MDCCVRSGGLVGVTVGVWGGVNLEYTVPI